MPRRLSYEELKQRVKELEREAVENKRTEEEIDHSYQAQTVLTKLLHLSLENISIQEMLEQFIDKITSIPWLALESKGGIFLVRDDPKVLVMSAHRELAKPLLKVCAQVPFGRCLCGRAALSGEIVFADSIDERHENRYEGIFSHGHYCIPIISRTKKVLGVITLYLREGHRQNHREEEFLNAVADTLAGIIERKRLEEKLIKSEKLAAIGETVAGLAHCIKNILFGFEGGVYVVNKALKKDDKAKLNTGWGIVRRNIDKVSNLVSDLLSYSKERTPEYESFSPNAIADEVCELMDPKAKDAVAGGIEIIKDFDLDICEVPMDRKGIHHCLVDLVSNAIDACKDDQEEDKKYLVKVSTRRERDGAVTFQVSDNGCGMDEALKKQALTMFFSTKGSKGTGLGLTTTQKIVREHGGTLSVNSDPVKGSVFTIVLPSKERGG
jgi:signal transduction histidine kinase